MSETLPRRTVYSPVGRFLSASYRGGHLVGGDMSEQTLIVQGKEC
jgi:hypothetical protein